MCWLPPELPVPDVLHECVPGKLLPIFFSSFNNGLQLHKNLVHVGACDPSKFTTLLVSLLGEESCFACFLPHVLGRTRHDPQ